MNSSKISKITKILAIKKQIAAMNLMKCSSAKQANVTNIDSISNYKNAYRVATISKNDLSAAELVNVNNFVGNLSHVEDTEARLLEINIRKIEKAKALFMKEMTKLKIASIIQQKQQLQHEAELLETEGESLIDLEIIKRRVTNA